MQLQDISIAPDIKDCDSEKAFIYHQTRLKAFSDYLQKPQQMIDAIRQGMNRAERQK